MAGKTAGVDMVRINYITVTLCITYRSSRGWRR